MPQISRFQLAPIDYGGESLGARITRIRKERGFTQLELATKIGIIQSIVSAVERDERKLSAEMAVRFAQALGISMDEMFGADQAAKKGKRPSRRILRRLEQIETLPTTQQIALLRTIDAVLKGHAVSS